MVLSFDVGRWVDIIDSRKCFFNLPLFIIVLFKQLVQEKLYAKAGFELELSE